MTKFKLSEDAVVEMREVSVAGHKTVVATLTKRDPLDDDKRVSMVLTANEMDALVAAWTVGEAWFQ